MFTKLQSPRKNDEIGSVPLTFQSTWPHIIVESIVVGRTFSFSSHIRVSMQFRVSHSAIFWMMEITGMTYSGRPFCKKQLKTWEHIFGLSRLIPKDDVFPSQSITHWLCYSCQSRLLWTWYVATVTFRDPQTRTSANLRSLWREWDIKKVVTRVGW